ncbi:MAG: HDOD domain-containing protein [Methylococcales bacterium]|nr:HDOD domain-containing protein [Methylococcales bacterium]
MGVITPQLLVKDSLELFSLPDIYFQISEMINDPRFTVQDIGAVIGRDPALTVRLLKIVNSSLYGFQSRVDRVSRAITIIGIEELKNLVLATSVVTKFRKIPTELVDMTDFWLRSVRCGMIAKFLAIERDVLHRERLFLTGLLHDIGSLVFYYKLPEKALEVLQEAKHNRCLIAGLEQEKIGFTHAELGSVLVKSWGLPESLYESIGHYLRPELAQVNKLDTYLLNLASQLSDLSQRGVSIDDVLTGCSKEGLSIIRLSVEQIEKVMENADEEFSQVFELMAPNKRFH